MKKNITNGLTLIIFLVIAFLNCGTVYAASNEEKIDTAIASVDSLDNNIVIGNSESAELSFVDDNGDLVKVGIQRVEAVKDPYAAESTILNSTSVTKTASSAAYKVYYYGGLVNCYYYVTVSNNKITSAYDDCITVYGGVYSDDILKWTSSYAKLTFKVTFVGDIASTKVWLKATPTGSSNKIKVTWT